MIQNSSVTHPFLPSLLQIKRRFIPNDKIRAAQGLVGADVVQPAISLVGYPEEVSAAMEYVFGGSFIAKTSEAARKVTFHKDIRVP